MKKRSILALIIVLGLMLAEFVIPGLVVFFFGIGAWVTALICWLTPIGINGQLILFIAVSVVSLLALRKWLKGVFYGHVTGEQSLTEDLQDFVGERAVVTHAIAPKHPGKVELHGTDWPACSEQDIAVGTSVEIVAKKNITLTVGRWMRHGVVMTWIHPVLIQFLMV